MFKYTNNWFDRNINISMKLTKELFLNKKVDILEIGSHEGKSTVWMLENLCNIEGSSFTSIDPYLLDDVTSPITNETYKLFLHNTKLCKNNEKLIQYIDKSENILPKLIVENKCYDIIYIDGSHLEHNFKFDLENSHKLIKKHGIIIMDDIGFTDDGNLAIILKHFLKNNKYKILLNEYQRVIQKL